MKKNVDLTENKIFSNWNKRTFILGPIDSISKFPWSFTNKNNDEHINEKTLFFTGYVKDIKFRKSLITYMEGSCCDRCGKSLYKGPWNFHYRLCYECDQDLETDVSKTWRIDTNSLSTDINSSSDRIVIELNYRS